MSPSDPSLPASPAPDTFDESIHKQPNTAPTLSPIDPDAVYDDPAVSDELAHRDIGEAAGDYDLETAGDDYADDEGDDGSFPELEREDGREMEDGELQESGEGDGDELHREEEDQGEGEMGAGEEREAMGFEEADN